MKNIDRMIAELEDTTFKDKRSLVYCRIAEVMGTKAAHLVLVLAEGVRAPEDYVSMRFSLQRDSAGMLTAQQSLVVLRWLKSEVIPILVEQ